MCGTLPRRPPRWRPKTWGRWTKPKSFSRTSCRMPPTSSPSRRWSMATTDTTEKGLEALITDSLVQEAGYQHGSPKDFDRDHAVDLAKLLAFLRATQPKVVEALALDED